MPGLPVKPRRFVAKLSYHGQPFASVPIEVSMVEAGSAEQFDAVSSAALALVGVPVAVTVPCVTVPWQIAQKLHACTAAMTPPKTNNRAHDLVDLQLLEMLVADADLHQTRLACIAVFDARAEQSWPPAIRALPHWPAIYDRAREGLDHIDLAETAAKAADRVQRFVASIEAEPSSGWANALRAHRVRARRRPADVGVECRVNFAANQYATGACDEESVTQHRPMTAHLSARPPSPG